jgi:hypothetical protein
METQNKILGWACGTLVTIVGFFLFMFYKKVDQIGDNVATMQTSSAVKEIQLKNIEERLTNMEKTVLIISTSKYNK